MGKCLAYLYTTESHLTNNNIIDLENYKWFGNNHSQTYTRAKTGSGGCGPPRQRQVVNVMNISIVDTTADGTIWVKITENTPSDN